MIDETLSACVVAYIGSVGRLNLVEPEQRVAELVGDAAVDVVPRIRRILDEVNSDPHRFLVGRRPGWDGVPDLYDAVAAHLVEVHPELSEAAVKAVANQFSYSYK